MLTPSKSIYRYGKNHPRLKTLPLLLPLYSTLKSRAAKALAVLESTEAEWCPCGVAMALGISLAELRLLERWALLPKGLERQATMLWLQGLAAMGKR